MKKPTFSTMPTAVEQGGTTPISDISEGNISVYGAITGIRETKTKKDGQNIAEYCHVVEMARLYKAEKGHGLKCLLAMPERLITIDFEVHSNFMKDRTISNRIVEI